MSTSNAQLQSDLKASQHAQVSLDIASLSLYQKQATFPTQLPDSRLSSNDYLQYLLLCHEKCQSLEPAKVLDSLNIICLDRAALEGLTAFNQSQLPLPFKSLSLNLSYLEHSENLLVQLQQLLVSYGSTNLQQCNLIDPNQMLNPTIIEALTLFIEQNRLPFDINLPKPIQHSAYQQRIDLACEEHCRVQAIARLAHQVEAVSTTTVIQNKAVRQRPKTTTKQQLSIDVELQQEQQIQVAVETQTTTSDAGTVISNAGADRLFNIFEFATAFADGAFHRSTKSYLLDPGFDNGLTLWGNWVGALSTMQALSNVKISQKACTVLLNHPEKFQYGLDLAHLPAGFSIKQHEGQHSYLDFNESLALLSKPAPLSVQLQKTPEEKPLMNTLLEKWLQAPQHQNHPLRQAWIRLSQSNYDKEAHRAFKQYFPKLCLLSPQELSRLFDLCLDASGNLKIDAFRFLLDDASLLNIKITQNPQHRESIEQILRDWFPENSQLAIDFLTHYEESQLTLENHVLFLLIDDAASRQRISYISTQVNLNPNALLQLYNDYGNQGIEQLIQVISGNPKLVTMLNKQIFAKVKSYSFFLESSFQQALEAISSFDIDDGEKAWWDALLAQHCQAQPQVDIIALVKTFQDFKQALKALPTEDNNPLKITPPCYFSGVKSLPIALSRIITLLEKTEQKNRKAVWKNISALDLSSTGAIEPLLLSSNSWAFIDPLMSVSAALEFNTPFTEVGHGNSPNAYLAPNSWKTITEIPSEDTILKRFLRYVASLERKAQLPLEFYQDAIRQIKASQLPEKTQQALYPILAAATTTASYVSQISSLREATEASTQIIQLLEQPLVTIPLPQNILDQVRDGMLMKLHELNNIPPLPILKQLLSMICTSYRSSINPSTLSKISSKVMHSLNELETLVDLYGPSIYEGMHAYTADDYQNHDLFFQQLAIQIKIAHALPTYLIKDLGQPGHPDLCAAYYSFLDGEISWKYYPLNQLPEKYKINKVPATDLLRSISLFHFTSEAIDNILTRFFHSLLITKIQADRRHEAITILNKIILNKLPRALNADDFVAILEAVQNEHQSPVLTIIRNYRLSNQASLEDCLPEDLLAFYGKPGIPEAINERLVNTFNDENQQQSIRTIFYKFNTASDSLHYNALLDKLIVLTASLTPLNKTLFLSKLANSIGLYTEIKPLEDDNNPFIKLLDTMIASKDTEAFLQCIATERNLWNQATPEQQGLFFTEALTQGLAEKTGVYIESILPQSKSIDDCVIDSLSLSPRLIEAFLKTSITELRSPSRVVSEKQPFYMEFNHQLGDVLGQLQTEQTVDFAQTQAAIDSFLQATKIRNSTTFNDFKNLNESLNHAPLVTEEQLTNRLDFFTMFKITQLTESGKERLYSLGSHYPNLVSHNDLLPALRANPGFYKKLAEPAVLDALRRPDLLDNDAQIQIILAALDADLGSFFAYKNQVTLLIKEVETLREALQKYPSILIELFNKINQIILRNPACKQALLALYDNYLQQYSPQDHGALIPYLWHFISTLKQTFDNLDNQNLVLSLCLQFNQNSNPELQPQGLLALLASAATVPARQNQLLTIAIDLINNDKEYNLGDFNQLCTLVGTQPEFADSLALLYDKAPIPNIQQVLNWHTLAVAAPNYALAMQEQCRAFDMQPYPRDKQNGFNLQKARKQLEKMQGFTSNENDLSQIKLATIKVRAQSTESLLEAVREYRNAQNPDYNSLVAITAELLYRSKGLEINTTQYLAILSALKTGEHVTSQIGTGEGKTRIATILIACQFALGNTIDFLTSDAQLASRDFISCQSYFNLLGASSQLITAEMDPGLYQAGGIHYSDPANMSLFRNRANSQGLGHLILDPNPQKRALILDEADKTYFDVADTRFNYSAKADDNISNLDWVYPLLIDYFDQKTINLDEERKISPLDLYYDNIDLSREKFLQFAKNQCQESELLRLKALPNAQIEQWQDSAVTASQLKIKEDFVIEPDLLINTPKGPKIASEAQLLFSNRVAKQAKYSFGVHQCLHARLNKAKNNLEGLDPALRESLAHCEQAFFVADEKQIIYSSTSKNLLDDYQEGKLLAITGTAGSIIERQEAANLYGNPTRAMHFIDVPRDKGLNRLDRPVLLTAGKKQQTEAMVRQIKLAREKQQPILIVAENDAESADLFKELQVDFPDKIQLIHSQCASKEEEHKIQAAGISGQITISTDMVGRGTDIHLEGASKDNGLHVMLTYLPSQRDLEQIIGRSGRFGDLGESRIILDKPRLQKALNTRELSNDFYLHTKAFIKQEQAIMDRNKQVKRLIKNTLGDFRIHLAREFFSNTIAQLANPEGKKQLLPLWSQFFDKTDKAWNDLWPNLQQILTQDNIDLDQINALLNEYQQQVQREWNTLYSSLSNTLDISYLDARPADSRIRQQLPQLSLSPQSIELLKACNAKLGIEPTTVYDYYDPAHDGMAVDYSDWRIPFIATLKGYANLLPGCDYAEARVPFANTKAWLDGHGILFADLRNNPNKWKIVGAAVGFILGTALGLALVCTGVFAPLGFALLGISMLICSSLVGLLGGTVAGAIADAVQETENENTHAGIEKAAYKFRLFEGFKVHKLEEEIALNALPAPLSYSSSEDGPTLSPLH